MGKVARTFPLVVAFAALVGVGSTAAASPTIVRGKFDSRCLVRDDGDIGKGCLSWSGFPAFSRKAQRIVFMTQHPHAQAFKGAYEIRGIRFDTLRLKTGKLLRSVGVIEQSDYYAESSVSGAAYKQFDRRFARNVRSRLAKVSNALARIKWTGLQPISDKKQAHPRFRLTAKADERGAAVEFRVFDRKTKQERAVRSLKTNCEQCAVWSTHAWVDPGGTFVAFRSISFSGSAVTYTVSYGVARLSKD